MIYDFSDMWVLFILFAIELDSGSFTDHIGRDKPAIVFFMTVDSPHCWALYDVYTQIATMYPDIVVAIVNHAYTHTKDYIALLNKYTIQHFPSIHYVEAKSLVSEEYKGYKDFTSIKNYIRYKSKIIPLKDQFSSNIIETTDLNYDSVVNGSKHVFIIFTAPWDVHGRRVLDIIDNIALLFPICKDLVFAKVNAEISPSIVSKYEIYGYPTLYFISKWSTNGIKYNSYNEKEEFIGFLTQKCQFK